MTSEIFYPAGEPEPRTCFYVRHDVGAMVMEEFRHKDLVALFFDSKIRDWSVEEYNTGSDSWKILSSLARNELGVSLVEFYKNLWALHEEELKMVIPIKDMQNP